MAYYKLAHNHFTKVIKTKKQQQNGVASPMHYMHLSIPGFTALITYQNVPKWPY